MACMFFPALLTCRMLCRKNPMSNLSAFVWHMPCLLVLMRVQTAHRVPASRSIARREKTRRILIVDDDKVLSGLLGNIVSVSGYVAEVAHDAGDAMDCLINEEGRFDLVITDYEMPGMNGIEFIRMARKRFPGLVVAGMSGNAFAEEEFLNAGATIFLQKPFRLEQIINLIVLISQKGQPSRQ